MPKTMALNGSNHIVQDAPAPIFTPQRATVVCIGAGVSGIALAIEMQRKLENFDLCIYEKNSDIGNFLVHQRATTADLTDLLRRWNLAGESVSRMCMYVFPVEICRHVP